MTGYLKRTSIFWLPALTLILLINVWSINPRWVENYYTNGIYRITASIQRGLFGWISFSIGDILYFLLVCWLLYFLGRYFRLLFKKKIPKRVFGHKLARLVFTTVVFYIIFYLFWGLNYDREEITSTLHLTPPEHSQRELVKLQQLLMQKVNISKRWLIDKKYRYPVNGDLFTMSKASYVEAEKTYPFLHYNISSVKSSLYGSLGNYLGFTGYYNPISGEAQVNTTVPRFLLPYITCHEIAHQIGYAKENEANFIGYLAAVNSKDTLFHYSAYLDLFVYTNREIFFTDTAMAKTFVDSLIPEVKVDLKEWRDFNLAHKSVVEPVISWLYGKYLEANRQPKGMRSYNEVVAMLISWYKKTGKL